MVPRCVARPALVVLALALLGCAGNQAKPASSKPTAEAQPDTPSTPSGFSALKSNRGVLLIYNGRVSHFTLEITGQRVSPPNPFVPEPMFVVDGQLVQIVTVPTSEFTPAAQPSPDILSRYMVWETEYTKGQFLKNDPSVGFRLEHEPFTTRSGIPCLAFGLNLESPRIQTRPDATTLYAYVTATNGGEVIAVSSPLKTSDPRPESLARLRGFMESLRFSAAPIDLQAEQARLRAEP